MQLFLGTIETWNDVKSYLFNPILWAESIPGSPITIASRNRLRYLFW